MASGMYVNCIEAQVLRGGSAVADKPRFRFLGADGGAYVAKSALCPKITSRLKNDFFCLPAWLAERTRLLGVREGYSLRVPSVARLSLAGETFVGSEV